MNLAKAVQYLEGYDLEYIKENLNNSGYDLAHGNTYSIAEIRKAVRDGQPSFVKIGNGIKNETIFIVGENPGGLVAYRDGGLYEVVDKDLRKAWMGEVVIVTDKRHGDGIGHASDISNLRNSTQIQKLAKAGYGEEVGENGKEENFASEAEETVCDFVIFACERDTWAPEFEGIKRKSKNVIERIKYLPDNELPPHPVIVMFKQPSDKESKEGIRAMAIGAEICIYDPSDPPTEFAHELGHVYWRTRLTDDEKDSFKSLHEKLSTNNLPSIITSKNDWASPEELFCTIYMWCLKGKLLHRGYGKILEQQYADGYGALLKVFNRIIDSETAKITMKARQEAIGRAWREQERQVSIWVNQLTKRPSKIAGSGLILKADIPAREPIALDFPLSDVEFEELSEYEGRTWIRVKGGILKGKILVIRNGFLDVPYMAQHKDKYALIPMKKSLTAANGKTYQRTVRVTVDNFERAMSHSDKIDDKKQSVLVKAANVIVRLRNWISG